MIDWGSEDWGKPGLNVHEHSSWLDAEASTGGDSA